MSLRTGLVSTNGLFREALHHLLSDTVIEFILSTKTIRQAIDAARRKAAALDILLVETPHNEETLGPSLRELKRDHPDAKCVLLDLEFDFRRLCWAYSHGVDGVLETRVSRDVLIESIILVSQGEKVFPSSLAMLLGELGKKNSTERFNDARPPHGAFSNREQEIIRCIVEGLANKQIAKSLNLTEATVKMHLKAIQRKVGAANRTQIAVWAVESGLSAPLATMA
ncbi:MAG: response regulator transcription factor [Pseudomonadota bacterium]